MGEYNDPAVRVPTATVLEWLQVICDKRCDHKRTSKTWELLLPRLLPARLRWQRVCGPAAATIATLLDQGWSPERYNSWLDPQGHRWEMPAEAQATKYTCSEVLAAFRDSVVSRLWEQASLLRMGKGLDKRPSLGLIRKHVDAYRRQGKRGHAGMLVTVACGWGLATRAPLSGKAR